MRRNMRYFRESAVTEKDVIRSLTFRLARANSNDIFMIWNDEIAETDQELIYTMDEFDDVFSDVSRLDLVEMVQDGDFSDFDVRDDFWWHDDNAGGIMSGNDVSDTFIDIEDVAEYLEENTSYDKSGDPDTIAKMILRDHGVE